MRTLAPLFLIVLFLTGCMSPEQRLIGKWKGTVEVSSTVKSLPFGAQASTFANMTDPQLDLRPDKTFTLYMSFAPIEGTWALAGKEVVLTPKKVMGMSADDAKDRAKGAADRVGAKLPFPIPIPMGDIPGVQEMRVKVLNDGDALSLDPGSGSMMGMLGKMTFKKV